MLKRIISLYLCAALVFSLLPAQVFATEEIPEPTESATEPVEETVAPTEEEPTEEVTEPTEEVTESTEEVTESTEEVTEPAEAETEATEAATVPEEEPELVFLEAQGIDSEELLMGYLSPIYTSGEGSFFGTMARDRLSPANQHLYDGLKALVVQLAKGEKNNTSIDVSFEDSGYSPVDADMTLVQEALLFDYPFEMYWYYGCYSGRGSNFYRVIMVPNPYYQADGFDHNSSPYIDTDKTKKASAAAENIYTIKTRYEASSDYDKLSAYVDEICALVEYDTEAAKNSETLYPTDNRPWTLINVFDNDPATNVVCEGYSEAFQYLCDESTFRGDVVCFSVTGDIPGGGHKWNIVRIEGISYLMDVTNYDYNHITDRSFLFLSGGTGSVAAGYTVDGILYTYHDKTMNIYGSGEDSVLKLSPTKYTPPATYTILYDANGGTNAPNSQKKTQGKDLILRQEIPTWSGHIFQGWATTSAATVAEYQPGEVYSAEGDAVLYAVWAEVISGICGENLTWELKENVLTISGTGDMYDFEYLDAPWHAQRMDILSVVITEGVTTIGNCAFVYCRNLAEISLPDGIIELGEKSFFCCYSIDNIQLPDSVVAIGNEAFQDCRSMTNLILPEYLTNIGSAMFAGCTALAKIIIPSSISSIAEDAFALCDSLTFITFTGSIPSINANAFASTTATAYYPANNPTWTSDVMQNYGGTITWVPYGGVENQVMIPAAELAGQTSVWIDGKEYTVKTDSGMPYVDLPDGSAKTLVVYTYGTSNGKSYPNGMKVWTLQNVDGIYTATRMKELDNILGYEGTSIRVTGNQGIRMITSVDERDKTALTGAGLAGYTLKEYGTAIAWASQISTNKPLTLGKSYVSSNYAYSRDAGKDPIFAYVNDRVQYTNVMVGFTLDQCEDDIAMRPYIILEDTQGNEITLYGGIVERSIGYIAAQNHDAFEEGTDAYNYVWKIITHVYGEDYIPEL